MKECYRCLEIGVVVEVCIPGMALFREYVLKGALKNLATLLNVI